MGQQPVLGVEKSFRYSESLGHNRVGGFRQKAADLNIEIRATNLLQKVFRALLSVTPLPILPTLFPPMIYVLPAPSFLGLAGYPEAGTAGICRDLRLFWLRVQGNHDGAGGGHSGYGDT